MHLLLFPGCRRERGTSETRGRAESERRLPARDGAGVWGGRGVRAAPLEGFGRQRGLRRGGTQPVPSGRSGRREGNLARGRRQERLFFFPVFIGEGMRMGAGANNQPLIVLRPALVSGAREGGGETRDFKLAGTLAKLHKPRWLRPRHLFT